MYRRRRRFRRWAVAALAAIAVAVSSPTVAAPPDAVAVMKDLGFTAADQAAIRRGEVVVRSLEELHNKEIVAVAAIYSRSSLDDAYETFAGGKSIEQGRNFRAMGRPDPSSEEGWEGASFGASETKEVAEILAAGPGLDLNLSSQEIAFLNLELADVPADERVQRVSETYREILKERFRAYAEKGLAGVAPYDRGKGKTSSAADAINAVWRADEWMLENFPEFTAAVDRFPHAQPEDISHEFFWVKEQFESQFSSRPTFVLEHHAWRRREDHLIVSTRQFFVGHTYSAQQGIGLALPFEDGVVIFNSMSISSDLVERYVRMIALPIGKKIMRSQLTTMIRDARAQLPQGTETPGTMPVGDR